MKTENSSLTFSRQRIFALSQFAKIISLIFILSSIYGCTSLTSHNFKSRIRAVNKLSDQDILYKIALDDVNPLVKDAATKKLSQSMLVKLVSESKELKVRLYAIYYLDDQKELLIISQNSDNWNVRHAAFRKLNDNSLDVLTRDAKDPALILGAKIRLGRISWDEAFSGKNKSTATLGDAIGAAALVDKPKPTTSDVVTACHNYIRRGDDFRIPELRNLLLRYGDKTLAEDYLNCGKSELADAAREWGMAHRFNVRTGEGSHRVRWGEH